MGPFQTKDDHLAAWADVAMRLKQTVSDWRSDEIGYSRFARELDEHLANMKELSNISLSDPDYVEPKPF